MSPSSDAKSAQVYVVQTANNNNDNAVKGKHFLCLVNPNSGRKDGLFQYEQVASVMLTKAGVSKVSSIETTHAGHFSELGESIAAQALKSTENQNENSENSEPLPDVICIFGGDTSMVEFVNGLVKHASDGSMDLNNTNVKLVLSKITLSIIPTGSSNGLAACYDARTTYEAIDKLITGPMEGAQPMDLMDITCVNESDGNTIKKVDVHCVSWGMLSDHAELTERKWRSLGLAIKELLAPLWLIAQRKVYKGTIRFKPVAVTAEDMEKHRYTDPDTVADDTEREESLEGFKRIEGEFILVTVMNGSWVAHDVCVTPSLGLADGYFSLVLMRGDVSRFQILRAFMAAEQGLGGTFPYIEQYKVSSVIIDADTTEALSHSGLEILDTRSIRVDVKPGAAQFWKGV